MFTKIAVFSLLASIVAANAVPYAEHANIVVRNAEPTTTSTEIVYVTITQTIPYKNADAKQTQGAVFNGIGHNETTGTNGTDSGRNGTITGPNGPEITDPTNSASGLQAGHVMGMMGLVGAFAFLL
ncbi:hypothetical protein DFH27DRAFT_522964 [Peziza echinospora]|nr:hypothetical protein DFH27DRAFT_522964 [Peziza echinospora]